MEYRKKPLIRTVALATALLASIPVLFGTKRTVDRYMDENSATAAEHAGRADPIIYNQARRRYDEFREDFENGGEFNREIYPRNFPPTDSDIEEIREIAQSGGRSGKNIPSDSSRLEIKLVDISYLFCGPCGRNNKTATDEIRAMSETLEENGYNFCIERDLVIPSISFDYDSKKLMGYGAVTADDGKSREVSDEILKTLMKNNNSVPQTVVYVNGVPIANHIGPLKKLDIVECVRIAVEK